MFKQFIVSTIKTSNQTVFDPSLINQKMKLFMIAMITLKSIYNNLNNSNFNINNHHHRLLKTTIIKKKIISKFEKLFFRVLNEKFSKCFHNQIIIINCYASLYN